MTEIVIAGPSCTPLRNQILTGLHQYGVTSARIVRAYVLGEDGDEGREGAVFVGGKLAVRQIYHVRISPQAAAWTEYLLLRTGKYELLSKPVDERNARWAAKWAGVMPQPWAVGDCAGRTKVPSAKPVAIKEDSAGFRLLRELRRR